MTDPALRRALWAVARVAGAAALIGCAPGTVGTTIPDTLPNSADDVPEPEPEPTCDELFVDLVAMAESGEHRDGIPAATEACCEDLIDEIDETGEWPTDPVEQNAQWVCCEALGFPASLACTPWGPPAPPAMPTPTRMIA